MKQGFELRTQAFDNGQIRQDLYAVHHGNTQRIQSSVVDTAEAQIRQALILLGWTPPPTIGTVEVPPAEVIGRVQLVMPGDPPPVPMQPAHSRVGGRLAHEVMVTSRESAAHALNHIAEACREDLSHQGMALQDFAIPALRWALLRIAVLETDLTRVARDRAIRPVYIDSRPAPLGD